MEEELNFTNDKDRCWRDSRGADDVRGYLEEQMAQQRLEGDHEEPEKVSDGGFYSSEATEQQIYIPTSYRSDNNSSIEQVALEYLVTDDLILPVVL